MTRWHYQGDVSLEYGGTFFDFSDMKYGYCRAVEVTDLDSAIGFRGAVMVEEHSIAMDQRDRWQPALSVIGATLEANGDINDNGRVSYRKNSLAWRMCLAYALLAYGHRDTDRSVILQLDHDEPTKFDGWTADRLRHGSLRGYVRREFLGFRR